MLLCHCEIWHDDTFKAKKSKIWAFFLCFSQIWDYIVLTKNKSRHVISFVLRWNRSFCETGILFLASVGILIRLFSLEQFIRPCARHNTTHTLHHKHNRGWKLNEDYYDNDTENGLKVFYPCMEELYVAFTFISHLLDAKGRDKNSLMYILIPVTENISWVA